MRRFRLITEDYEGSQKLDTYGQQGFKRWYKKTTGRSDDFYFDYINCVDGRSDQNIPGVKCDIGLTWEEAKDRLVSYFKGNTQDPVTKCFLKVFNNCFNDFCSNIDSEPIDNVNIKRGIRYIHFSSSFNFGADLSYTGTFTMQFASAAATYYAHDLSLDEPYAIGYIKINMFNKLIEVSFNKNIDIALDKAIDQAEQLLDTKFRKLSVSGLNSDDLIYKLATETNMTSTDVKQNGMQSLYSRPAMSYSNSFKYGDIFSRDSRLRRLIEQEYDAEIRAAWRYKDDPDIVLISTPGFNFISTTDVLGIE